MIRTLREQFNKEILCTIGPASLNDYVLTRLAELGVNLLRINLSHTRLGDLHDIIQFIQSRVSIPLCLDTEGAQIRTGDLPDEGVLLPEHSTIYVNRDFVSHNSSLVHFYPDDVVDKLEIGDFLSIDYNHVIAQVIDKTPKGLLIRILTGGRVGRNKAVTVMNRNVILPPLTEKDRKALRIGSDMDIRYVALSFASRASDVGEILTASGKDVFVISKIESLSGLAHLEEIAARSDALLIDRGDLSREVAIEVIPQLQKRIINYAKKAGIKIYVATNLLESMVKSPAPTRAEVNDIFNTLNDGADGLVLAAETAIGSYPVNCVMMVSKMIQQFHDFSKRASEENLQRRHSFLLVEPHGGILINRMKDHWETEEIKQYKTLEVDLTVLLNAEQIALGTFSPLEGFMDQKEVDSVLRIYRLPSGVVWPLPIVLQVPKDGVSELKIGETVALKLRNTDETYALLYLEDIYTYDLDRMCIETFGTKDESHPGVQLLRKGGEYFLGGKIDLIKRLPSEYKYYELTPAEVRTIFETKGWSKVVGFHTRNVIHRAHEHIQILALEKYYCDGLFVHPIIGPKKRGDYTARIILKSYELMVKNHYPKGRVLLGAFQNYSRYSGPREAIFTALCRKNFGCSHFIVGRDHTGVGNYYKSDDAKKMFVHLGNIGITPIFFGELQYCSKCQTYVEECSHGDQYILRISGTEGRKILESKVTPPDWFMRREICDFIAKEIREGREVFVE